MDYSMGDKIVTNGEVKALRLKLKLNQTQFWSRVGVEQSTSSRYEQGRDIPESVQTLLVLAYWPKAVSEAAYKKLRS